MRRYIITYCTAGQLCRGTVGHIPYHFACIQAPPAGTNVPYTPDGLAGRLLLGSHHVHICQSWQTLRHMCTAAYCSQKEKQLWMKTKLLNVWKYRNTPNVNKFCSRYSIDLWLFNTFRKIAILRFLLDLKKICNRKYF